MCPDLVAAETRPVEHVSGAVQGYLAQKKIRLGLALCTGSLDQTAKKNSCNDLLCPALVWPMRFSEDLLQGLLFYQDLGFSTIRQMHVHTFLKKGCSSLI